MPAPAKKDPLESRSFWPRYSQPGVFADVDQDRPCGNCGYNLRGLPPRQPCPECGSVNGLNLSDEPIPWDDKPSILSFLATVAMLIGSPHDLARQVWRPVRMDVRAARKFRNISVAISALTIAAVTFVIAQRALDAQIANYFLAVRGAMLVVPVSLVCAIVWFHGLSLVLDAFIRKGNAPGPIMPRARAVALYPSATFVLAPVQLILLVATTRVMSILHGPPVWIVPALAHFALLVLSLLPGIVTAAWIVYELVDISPGSALAMTFISMILKLIAGVVMLIVFPAIAAMLAASVLSP